MWAERKIMTDEQSAIEAAMSALHTGHDCAEHVQFGFRMGKRWAFLHHPCVVGLYEALEGLLRERTHESLSRAVRALEGFDSEAAKLKEA